MQIHKSITFERLEKAIEARNGASCENPGFCVTCGKEHDCCEPDAREYTCEGCETKTVYAPEEILMEGWVS